MPIAWDVLARHARPGDLIFFRGAEVVSKAIAWVQHHQTRVARRHRRHPAPAEWTHVGILVDHRLLPGRGLALDEWYVLESTMSGAIGDGVCACYGPALAHRRGFFGVQLRSLREILAEYERRGLDARVGLGCVRNLPRVEDLAVRFTAFFDGVNWTPYNASALALLASAYPALRPLRGLCNAVWGNQWLFCSELVATWINYIGLVAGEKVTLRGSWVRDVLPADFLGVDADGLPQVCDEPILFYCAEGSRFTLGRPPSEPAPPPLPAEDADPGDAAQ